MTDIRSGLLNLSDLERDTPLNTNSAEKTYFMRTLLC
jgi:hypothetical protein